MNLLASVPLAGGSIIDLDGTIFVQLGLFVVAFLLLYFFVFRPMVALFDAREIAIDGAKDDATRLQKEAKDASKTFDHEMAKVRHQASEERERLRQEGVKLERSMLEAVRVETHKKLGDAEKSLVDEGIRLRSELKKTIPALANQIAAKLLEREVR
ncbi:MAG: ATP synthase F0 subunit B [Polyangiaceae bacterium]|nr:ATP synthase F0 subunit B [Polyangiaceae bacterium]